jgi:catechol 2,3-dioxygenase-like lactoylglutathione lyase family enzyme
VVSLDRVERFDPELSMREPLELQVWPDGSVTVEIEFTGDDIRAFPATSELAAQTLAEWGAARSWRLDSVYNDRGRSLPDIWNARFAVPGSGLSVGSAVGFAGHAIGVAESCRTGGVPAGRLLELLRAGDADGLLGAPVTGVFWPSPGPLPDDEAGRFGLASEVCAFANSVPGGLLVLGLKRGSGASEGRVAAVRPFPLGHGAERVADIVRSMVFPEPDGLAIEAVPVPSAGTGEGLIAVSVPPQDSVLKPFLVHGTLVERRYQAQFASIVERRGMTVYAQPVAALHAQLAAGRALLRRGPLDDG